MFEGACASDAATPIPAETLKECCNRGYARESCRKAARVEPDASRFLVRSDRDGWIEVAWASERNHHPVAVGTLRLEMGVPAGPEPLERQARAFASAYLRQKGPG